MKYSLADCQRIYKFFDKDFFQDELGVKLGNCTIYTDKDRASRVFKFSGDEDNASGYSYTTEDNKNFIYVNKMLLDNKKLLANTILHEMIHLYVFKTDEDTRSYRQGHGSLWTKTAKYATSIYGKSLGPIERFADDHEEERKEHYKLMHSTKTLSNAYVVVLKSRDLIPLKELSAEQIADLKRTNIRGIFRVKPNLEQSAGNRVKCYATFSELMDDINYGITEEEEERYSQLSLKLGTESEMIWINPTNRM